MEIKDAVLIVVLFAIVTLIVYFFKARKKQRIGYLVNIFNDNFNLRVGILNLDYEKTFTIAIENTGKEELIVTDIFLEIKENNKFKKYELPNTVFDKTNVLQIPSGTKGAAMMDLKSFQKIFQKESIFKAVVVLKDGTVSKSNNLIISDKKEINLK